MREIPFTSLQFPLYEYLKYTLSGHLSGRPLRPHEAGACGSIAGGVAAALTTPLDVLKTRAMLDMKESGKSMPTLLDRFLTIYRTEGPKALFSGIVPRTLWISAGGAVFLGAYEWAIEVQR